MSSSGISISRRSLGTSGASVLRFLCVSGGFSSRKRFMRCAVAPRMSHRGSDKVVRRKAVRVTACTCDICRHSDASCAWMLVGSKHVPSPNTRTPRRACATPWTAPRGGQPSATGGSVVGGSLPSRTTGRPPGALLRTTAPCVPCRGNTLAGTNARGGVPRRGTSV